jgi:hypothetical protein
MTTAELTLLIIAGALLLLAWFVWRCVVALGKTDEWDGEY